MAHAAKAITNAISFSEPGTASSKDNYPTHLIRVSGPSGFSAIAHVAILNEDVDGAPRTYGPFSKGPVNTPDGPLDYLGNATNSKNPTFDPHGKNPWKWVGVVSKPKGAHLPGGYTPDKDDPRMEDVEHHFPVKKPPGDPDEGFYISTTASSTGQGDELDQEHYWNAVTIPYVALTPPLYNLGVRYYDVGLAMRNGVSQAFIFADWGNGNLVGECSRFLFETFFPDRKQEHKPVTFLVFPRSGGGTAPTNDPDKIDDALGATLQMQFGKLALSPNVNDLVLLLAAGVDTGALKKIRSNAAISDQVRVAADNFRTVLRNAGLRFPSGGPVAMP